MRRLLYLAAWVAFVAAFIGLVFGVVGLLVAFPVQIVAGVFICDELDRRVNDYRLSLAHPEGHR